MSDEIDRANERSEQFLQHSLGNAMKAKPTMPPIGCCYNCEAPLEGDARFCDSDCRDDFQLRMSRG